MLQRLMHPLFFVADPFIFLCVVLVLRKGWGDRGGRERKKKGGNLKKSTLYMILDE